MISDDEVGAARPADDDQDTPAEVPTRPFLIVGVGASAGGLEALGELASALPFDHLAFIIVPHLSPTHDAALTQLLARNSSIQVVSAADGMAVETNHVYVLPPNADLAIMHGVLHLITPAGTRQPRLPIDHFFRSLAQDQGPAAVGIVLSGTGTDGTFGLKAIKAAGGITFAQEPTTAKFDDMPRSALASGFADFSLPPSEMAAELIRLSKRSWSRARRKQTIGPQVQEQLVKLFLLIRSEFGTDLSHYKLPTVERRVERRMLLHKIARLEDYVRYVYANGEELRALYGDMLITVTRFFRDEDAFEALKEKVYPQLVARKETSGPIRVWVPACATGEEAYSIAITLAEYLEDRGLEAKLQIFGTDIDDDSIHFARRGVYAPNIALDVSPERLARFFVRKDGDYQIARRIRDLVVFSRQNLLRDAPFSRIGLVSCRNVLIYLQPPAQKKVLRTLNYALCPTGVLLLGSSETVGDLPDLFTLIDRRHKLYAKKYPAAATDLELSFGLPGVPDPAPHRPQPARPVVTLQAIADRKVLELHGPPGVVINEHLEILQFRGQTGPYLSPAPGAASLNLLRVARPELHVTLKRTVQDAIASQTRVTTDLSFSADGEPCLLRIEVVPVQEPETNASCLLVLFKRLPSSRDVLVSGRASIAPPDAADAHLGVRVQELERELALTKEYLQATIEEKETANEELKSSNEELQSSNEELQSTNEELETSKEEMRSTNEELTTVNDELQTRMYELSQSNDDLHNLLLGIEQQVVIIGMDLRIRRYTASAERLFNFVPGDVGRSVQFLEAFCGPAIQARVAGVIQNLSTIDDEILGANQRWYALRILPYKTLDHAIRGAILSLVDIDLRKRSAEVTASVSEYASRMLAAIGHPLLIVDDRQRVVWANDRYFEVFRRIPEATLGTALGNLGGLWSTAPLPTRLAEVLAEGKSFRGLAVQEEVPGRRSQPVTIGASRLPDPSGAKLALISIEPDRRVVDDADGDPAPVGPGARR